jgi:predicted DCC family thiol-disulfide oxidoreductase YuxK
MGASKQRTLAWQTYPGKEILYNHVRNTMNRIDVPLVSSAPARYSGGVARPSSQRPRFFSIRKDTASTSPLRILYDSKCPLCLHEVSWLERRSKLIHCQPLALIDIAQPDYDPKSNQGITYEDAMKAMHVIRGDGAVFKGVPAFEVMYQAVGLGWIFWALKFPLIRSAADIFYALWARYRLRITGRPESEMTRCTTCNSKS